MKSFVAAGLVVVYAAAAFAQGQLTITSPPSLVTCLPASITASGGTGPYTVRVLPGGQAGAAALADLGTTSGQLTWNVNLAAGTSVTLEVRDSVGGINYSAPLTIQAGSTTACVGQSATVSGATGTSATPVASTATSAASSALSSASSAARSAASSAQSAASSAVSAARSAVSSAASPAASSSGSTGAGAIVRPAVGALAVVGAAAYLLL